MKIYKNGELIRSMQEDDIFAMSNIRGIKVKVPHKLPFSFYFSDRESNHAIRVKVVFNPSKIIPSQLGSLELHGNWEYIPGPNDGNVSDKMIQEMKAFFKTYKVLFTAVWEMVLHQDTVYDYFRGVIDFSKLLTEFDFYEDYKDEMNEITSIEELEDFVRDYNLFNMWD